jgi:hypothetical protein
MVKIELPLEQWQQVLSILARAPWSEANPLIMAIGDQARAQAAAPPAAAPTRRGNGVDAEAASHEGRSE